MHTSDTERTPTSLVAGFGFDEFITAAAFIALASMALGVAVQSDTWWQLRTGQFILQTHSLPTSDSYSWTVHGVYWPNHEWLAEVLFYSAYVSGGMRLAAALCALSLVTTWALIYRLSAGSRKMRAYTVLAGIAAQSMIWSMRPALFSLLFVAVALTLISHRRRQWWLPLLFLIWANTHAGVSFGGVILVATAGAALLVDRRSFPRWAAITAVCAAATLATPLGLGLWRLVLHTLADPSSAVIEEWRPPSLMWPISYPFLALLSGTVVVIWRQRRRWTTHFDWTLIVCACVFGLLGLKSIRHAGTFALIAAALISREFADVRPTPAFTRPHRLAHVAMLTALAFAGGCFALGRWLMQTDRPALGPATVNALRACPEQLFNTYELGGQIIWAVPDHHVFVDNRWDPYAPEFIMRTKRIEATGDYRALFDEYRIQCALIPAKGPLPGALVKDGWVTAANEYDSVMMRAPAREP